MTQILKSKTSYGPILVSLAAFLWATDALIRYPAIREINPTWIVLVEHILAIILLLPWVLYHHRKKLFKLNKKEWMSSLYCGLGGSALGTVFFTSSFIYVNPSVSVLLQKLQPIFVVFFAYMLLGEKPEKKFYVWGWFALISAIVLSFPNLDFSFLHSSESHSNKRNSIGIWLALGSAGLWALSTVAGKISLERTPVMIATFWRFFFGCLGLLTLAIFGSCSDLHFVGNIFQWETLFSLDSFLILLYLSLIPGIFAMIVYYKGLAKTPANISTFIELLYPIAAVLLNTLFLGTSLSGIQVFAALILILSIAKISFKSSPSRR